MESASVFTKPNQFGTGRRTESHSAAIEKPGMLQPGFEPDVMSSNPGHNMTQHNILMLAYSAAITGRHRKSASRCESWSDEDRESLQGRMMCDTLTVTINLTKGH